MKRLLTSTSLVLLATLLCAATAHAQTSVAPSASPVFNTVDLTGITPIPIAGRSVTTRSVLNRPHRAALRTSAHAASPADEVVLHRGLFKPLRFSYQDREPAKVYGFGGLSFREEFEAVMSEHPPALDAAGRARVYHGVKMGGTILMLIGSIQLAQGLNPPRDESGFYTEAVSTRGLGTQLVGVVIMGVGSILSKRALNRGVRMFNEHQQIQSDTATPAQR